MDKGTEGRADGGKPVYIYLFRCKEIIRNPHKTFGVTTEGFMTFLKLNSMAKPFRRRLWRSVWFDSILLSDAQAPSIARMYHALHACINPTR